VPGSIRPAARPPAHRQMWRIMRARVRAMVAGRGRAFDRTVRRSST
jgi:hypothetical protein